MMCFSFCLTRSAKRGNKIIAYLYPWRALLRIELFHRSPSSSPLFPGTSRSFPSYEQWMPVVCPFRGARRRLMSSLTNQLRQVFRRLTRAPMFAVITLVTLAAAVGANTVVFSVLEGVLLKPLPYPRAEQLASLHLTAPGIQLKDFELSPYDYFIFREQGRTFEDIGLYTGDSVSVTGMAEPEQVSA